VKSPEILRRLVRRFGLLLALTLIGGVAGAVYGAVKTPTYTAKAYVVAIGDPGDSISALNFAQAYGRVATSGPVLVVAAAKLGTDQTGLNTVTASTSPDAPVIEITATARTGQHAAQLANAVANALAEYGSVRKTDTHVSLALLAGATTPGKPSSPKPPLELAVGAAAGLLIGGLAVLAGVGRASATRLRVARDETASARYAAAEVDLERPDRPADIERYLGSWRVQIPPKAITAYRSKAVTGNLDDLEPEEIVLDRPSVPAPIPAPVSPPAAATQRIFPPPGSSQQLAAPPVSGPPHSPSIPAPPVAGSLVPTLVSPSVRVPKVSAPPVSGPPVSAPVSGPPVSGPVSGPPVSAAASAPPFPEPPVILAPVPAVAPPPVPTQRIVGRAVVAGMDDE
jgi:capsular polysaccharide biosynthesis protein